MMRGRAVRGEQFGFAIIGLADGVRIAAGLREQGLACPVLLLTDGEAPTTQEALVRPFRFSSLLARLHALATIKAHGG